MLQCDVSCLLDTVLLVICQTFHQTDIFFLLIYGLYSPMCQQEGKGLQGRGWGGQLGRWGVGWGGQKKYRPMSPGLPLIELQPLRARPPDKRTNSGNGARAQDTLGTRMPGPLRAATLILEPPPGHPTGS